MKIKYTHTNINAFDWKKLSQFYKDEERAAALRRYYADKRRNEGM